MKIDIDNGHDVVNIFDNFILIVLGVLLTWKIPEGKL